MKHVYFLFSSIVALVILAEITRAQSFEWTRYSTGSNAPGQEVVGWGIDMDAQGNRYVAGNFSHPIVIEGDTLYSVGGSGDIFTAKYDTTGALQWVAQAGGIYHDYGLDIAVDDSGNCYVAGTFQGIAYFDTDSVTGIPNISSVFLAKYNNDGVIQWVARAIAPSTNVSLDGVAISNSGRVFITGGYRNFVNFYHAGADIPSDTLQSVTAQYTDVYTACYNSGGSFLWAKSAGSGSIDKPNAVTTNETGDCYVAGEFYGTIDFDGATLVSEGSQDIFIAKYHASGNLDWATSFGSLDPDDVSGISVDASDNIYLTGFADTLALGPDTLTGGGTGGGPFLAKFDPNASPLWAREPIRVDITSARFESVDVASSGQCYVTGSFTWPAIVFGNDTLSAWTNGDNMMIAHFSTDGEVLWARHAGGTHGHIVGYDVSVGPANRSYVSGAYGYDAFFGPDTLSGGPGFFVTKFSSDDPLAIEPPSSAASTYFLRQNYPNPFNPSTTIEYELPAAAKVRIIIYNLLGQKVRTLVHKRLSAGFYEATWDGNTDSGTPAASGMYIYQLTAAGAVVGLGNRFSQARKMLLIR